MISTNKLQKIAIGFTIAIFTSFAINKLNSIKTIFLKNKESKLKNNPQQYRKQQLSKEKAFFGINHVKLVNSYVVVFGVGGVGSHVVNILARSGIKKIRIIDFDRVSLSSLNRHAFALRQDVGISKVQCIKKYVNKIFPDIQIQTIAQYVTKQNVDKLIPIDSDFVIDCIDNIDAKVQLVIKCVQKKLKIIVSGGAGMKNDATRLQVGDISHCKYDELISSLRKKISKFCIKNGVNTLFSYQQAQKQLLPLNSQQQKDPHSFRVFENYRIRIIPVLGTMPAIIGMAIASYVICDLAQFSYERYEIQDIKSSLYSKIYSRLVSDQKNYGVESDEFQFDLEDVYVLMRYVFKWTCFLTGKKDVKHFFLARWDINKKANLFNLIAVCPIAYEKHIIYPNLQSAQYSQNIYKNLQDKWKIIRDLKMKNYVVYK